MKIWSWRHAVQESKLNPTTKLVLYNLSINMDESGKSCFPSTKKQAEDTGLSERTICTHLNLAESAGFISKSKHGYGGQKWARNDYEARYPKGTELASVSAHKGTEPNAEGTEPNDTKALNVVQSNTTVNTSMNTPLPPIVPQDGFEEFWKEYPHCKNRSVKSKTKTQFGKMKEQEREKAIHSARQYSEAIRSGSEDGQYAPAAERWLRDKKYEYEYENQPTVEDARRAGILQGMYGQLEAPRDDTPSPARQLASHTITTE